MALNNISLLNLLRRVHDKEFAYVGMSLCTLSEKSHKCPTNF